VTAGTGGATHEFRWNPRPAGWDTQPMTNIGQSIDLYIGHLARQGRRPTTLTTYRRLLNDFADTLSFSDVRDLELHHYERFLNRWVGKSPSTLASGISLVKGYSAFLDDRGITKTDVAHKLRRPRRQRYADLDVVSVSSGDVEKMIAHCHDWQELLCVTTAAYLGARRRALATVRRGDVDLAGGLIRFAEKGGKIAVKPMPDEYLAILRTADHNGVWAGPEEYLIPNRRPASVRRPVRSDKVIWNTIKTVAARAGVRAHVHALRAAFAVQFDAAHPGEIHALKELMGHANLETTLIYLRRKDKARAMETVRDLSFGSPTVPSSHAAEAHTGFEPVLRDIPLSAPILRRLDDLRVVRARRGERV
jgi:integrase